ncbi:MAG: cation transporter [Oscillospiraceae bacterium]|nr:cation transporter [Oscillospiraceae bacterium]
MELKVKINGMHCPACAKGVQRAFCKLPGVAAAQVDHATGEAVLTCPGEAPSREQLAQAVEALGFHLE